MRLTNAEGLNAPFLALEGYMSHFKHKNKGRFAGIPHSVMEHPDYYNLSGNAIKLLLEIVMQYNGANNGKLCAVFSQLNKRGWKSQGTLDRAKKELLRANLITITKICMFGQNGKAPLYFAITWQNVDEIKGFTMDIEPTKTPLRAFSLENSILKAA